MNREKVIDDIFQCKEIKHLIIEKLGTTDTVWLLRVDVIKKVESILDSYENRSCENCKFMVNSPSRWCGKIDEYCGHLDRGCSNWKEVKNG